MTKQQPRILDMTQGNPLGMIVSFAIPILIGNIFQQLYNMVDTMVVGYSLGEDGIAAIGATSALYLLLLRFATGLNSGCCIVVTQQFGARNFRRMKQAVAGMILLNLGVNLLLTMGSLVLMHPLLRLLNTPQSIYSMAYAYIRIVCIGITVTISYNMFAAILHAVGNSRTPLLLLIFSSLLNVALDVLFVVVFGWGVGGAAAATVLAQAVSAVLSGIYVFRNYPDYMPGWGEFRCPRDVMKDLLSTGFSMAMMSCLVDVGSVIFSGANNLLGGTYIAAHTACRRLLTVMIEPLGTLSLANSTFVGQNWGARKYGRIQKTLRKVLLLEIGWGLISIAVAFLFGAQLVYLTTGTQDAEMVKNAVLSMRIHFAGLPILGVLFVMRNTLQSMGYKLIPICSSAIELAIKIFSAAWLIPKMGFLGTCITEPGTWVIMTAFLLGFYFLRYKEIFAAADSK